MAMIRKEWMEMWRNYKWVMVPIVFMILGAMQPISFYYMPEILKNANLPEGTVLQIPPALPSEAMTGVYTQFNQIGLLILVLISMGAIATERKSGVADLILVKPISIPAYILSKWVGYISLTTISTLLGVLMGWFYTVQLIGDIEIGIVLSSTAIYLVYLFFIITTNLFFSSLFSSGIVAGGLTILISIGISILTGLPFDFWWIPSYLNPLTQMILKGETTTHLLSTLLMTALYIVILILTSIFVIRRKES